MDSDLKPISCDRTVGFEKLTLLAWIAQRLATGRVSYVQHEQEMGVRTVLKQADQISLDGLLESTDSRRLEAQVRLEVLGDLTNETLEGELSDEELSRLLVTTDLTKSDGTRLVSVGLLDTPGRWCRLAG